MRNTSVALLLLVTLLASPDFASALLATTDQDAVALHNPVISGDGAWVAAEECSDRGGGRVRVWSTDGNVTYTIERGWSPRFSRDSRWVSALQKAPAEESKTDGPTSTRAGQTLVLLDIKDGSRRTFDFVISYDVTYTASYLIYLQSPDPEAERVQTSSDNAAKSPSARDAGTLQVVHLNGDKVFTVNNVTQYIPHLTHANHETNDHYAYVMRNEETGRDTLYMALVNPGPDNRGNFGVRGIHPGYKIEGLRWAHDSATAVFFDRTETTGRDGKPHLSSLLYTWHDVPGRPGPRVFTRVDTQ